jgi:cytochrome P450
VEVDESMKSTMPVPGPRWLSPLDWVRSQTNPRAIFERMVRTYGDPFGVSVPAGHLVFTGHPDGARAVFTADPETFDIFDREKSELFLGPSSLILTTGARHTRDRRLLAPPFHGARMRAYGETMIDAAERAAARWTPGRPFSMLEATQSISLDLILRAVFGVEGDERAARFVAAVRELTASMMSPLIHLFAAARHDFGGLGPWARFRRAVSGLAALLQEQIDARRAGAEGRDDILALLMSARFDDGSAMSDEELRDQLHLLLFAGHETTATALAWAFYWLHRQPEDLARLLAEVDALGPRPPPEALAALPYLDAICQETLRIHPVVPEVIRLLRRPLDVMGHTLPAGTGVGISMLLLHDRADVYPEPRRFLPARFLDRKPSPYEFAPFGGGARRCLGAAFALYEMKIVLATLLRTRRFRLAVDAPIAPTRRGPTMGPKGGVPMILEGSRPHFR